jgi:acyl-CoA synthetase (AMP-forming)/AMP-acid ligase II
MGFINAGALLLDAIARCRPEDTVYSVLPLQHAMGINLLAGCLWLGATLALRRKFSAVAFLDDIRKFNASVAGYIGEIPRYVYNMPEKSDDTSHPLEKMVGIGFGHDLWEKFKQRFGVKEIYELYGASEGITPIANVDQRPGMLGRIYDESAARLVRYDLENDEFLKDENGTLVKCAVPGEVGMYITTAGTETGFTGYTDRGETESKILKNAFTPGDRWFISGDLMKLHGGRWVSFVDRRGDTFRWKGENVSTREVEDILGEFPAVEIVAVYGVQVPGMPGQAGMAAVIKRQDREWDWKIFSDLAGNNLPPWAVPRFIRFIESFEMTHTMKIVKVTLRKQGFDPALVGGGLFFWDVDAGMYEPMDIEIHRKILAGTIKI